VGGFGAASVAGFEPVGQVLGTTVAYLGPSAFDRCYVTGSATRADEKTSADPHNPLLARLYAARRAALERAVAECQALGGDGIIGARMSCTDFLSGTVELTVEGTAVRARSATRPAAPFTTHVGGQDLARLLRAGWMPFALVFGIAIAAGHFDQSMFQQTRRGIGAAGNREVSGYTRLVNDARREARRALGTAVGDQGGQGAVAQEMTLHFTERECPSFEERADYVVEATIPGSAIVSFERRSEPGARRAPLAIMRLDRGSEAMAEPEPGPGVTAGPSLGDRALAYWSGRRESRATGSSDAP
jgi:uncharacterized protein YbjQ (UPF0145 family)